MSFFGFGLMLPDAANRVSLDPRRRDAWGIPVAQIRCIMGDGDKALLRAQLSILCETVKGAGGELEFIGSPLGLTEFGRGAYPGENALSRFIFRRGFRKTMIMGAAIHESGGARMGHDPGDSVLNPYNQCWDVPNLYVTDASAFVGSGVVGTTLTVMAMTVRACRRLASEMRSQCSSPGVAGAAGPMRSTFV